MKNKISGIDLPKFKKWVKKEIGSRPCADWSFDCLNCFTWEIYSKMESLAFWIKMLDDEDVDKKKIRRHKKYKTNPCPTDF